jgi:RHS repeat-associated protein
MNARMSLMGFLLLGFGLAAPGKAQTFILPAAADTSLSHTFKDQNFGGDPVLNLAMDFLSSEDRAVVRMDQAAIASAVGSARLVSASLQLFLKTGGLLDAGGHFVEAHRVTEDWTEAGATWSCGIDTKPTNNKPDCATPWNGGSFAAEAADSVLHSPEDQGSWIRFDVTADVAAFLSGTANFGWLLRFADGAGGNQLSYTSREGAAEERPRLVLLVSDDQVPPALAITAPANGSIVTTATPTISATYSDAGSGIDVASVQLLLDGADRTAEAQVTAAGLTFTPATSLAEGDHTVEVTVRDLDGNESHATAGFTIDLGPGLPPDPATVAPPLDPTVATDLAAAVEFLYAGDEPIQTGVAPGTIDARRVAVLRGLVLLREGDPLPGVQITVLNHAELGATLSRADGMFDLAVNGGGPLTLEYAKAGYLPVQRTVDTPWRDYARVEDVVLVPLDPQATQVTSGAAFLQVTRGGAVSDEDGDRRATVLFPAGTQAELVLPDGSRQPLATLTVRATEYTVAATGQAAMPAPLPPSSGYTYAVELSADEATAARAVRVDFNQPVVFYLENFLDFPVGGIVPAGSYDRQKAAWLPSGNGRVVEILSVTAGLADLDVDGSGVPADAAALAALGIGESERSELATLYTPGQTLWRVPVPHFSPWDCNWPYGPPADAEEPPDPKNEEDDEGDEDDPCNQSGSIIECENQILGEAVPIVGTPFSLHYQSDRVPGRRASRTIEVLLSESQVPASLLRIELVIHVAGRQLTQSFAAAPNLTYTFTWDGKDAYGRAVQGELPATIDVGYVYGGVYYTPAQFDASFASFSSDVITVKDRLRGEITLWRQHQRIVGTWDARAAGLGGWDLDVHHAYDPIGRKLFLGDGTRRRGDDLNRQMDRVPFSSLTAQTRDAEAGPDGSVYVLDDQQFGSLAFPNISRLTPDGELRSTGITNFITGMGVAPDGSVYFANCRGLSVNAGPSESQVWRLAPNGITTALVLGPDRLGCPWDVAVDQDGTLLVADSGPLSTGSGPQKILRVWPDGSVATVAGSDDPAAPDSGPALQVGLDLFFANLAVGPDGSIYFTEPNKHRIRRIGRDGQVVTVAGTDDGTSGFSEDGTPAAGSPIESLRGLTVAPDGSVFFPQPSSARVRRITPSGLLATEIGGGPSGFPTGGLQPPSTPLLSPTGVAFRPNGEMFISAGSSKAYRVFASSTDFSTQDIPLSSADGGSVYLFNHEGRHLSTRNALTGATTYNFTYDSAGNLATVEDPFDNVTRIEHDALGHPTAIVAPFGQRTELAVDANGFLSSIRNPANEETQLTYTADGLLLTLTDPRGATAHYTYSDLGRLLTDQDRAGGVKQLQRFPGATGYESVVVSPLGLETHYTREDLPDGQRVRSTTSPAGLTTTSARSSTGTVVLTEPSGTVTTSLPGADPRFGMQSPITSSLQVRTPSGLTFTGASTRTATLANPADPFSLTTLQETYTANGRTSRMVYDASQRELTFTTAAGRTSATTLDAFGRPVVFEVGGLAPINLTYDARGRLSVIAQGAGADQRTITLGYSTNGWLSDVSAPLGYHIGLEHDAAGRVLRQTLPDGRQISFSYDTNGNLATLTPPTRPSHAFSFSPVDLPTEYAPPALGSEPNRTTYSYNLDRQPTRVTRPDERIVELTYGTEGRIAAIGFSLGEIAFSYQLSTGNLSGLSAPGENLGYTYDGALPTGTTWSGTVSGSVTRTYNADFRVTTESVNGANSIAFQYDADGLLSQAGDLTLTRSTQNGLMTGTDLDQVTTARGYNAFGELAALSASFQGTSLRSATYSRDQLGRILQKIESVGGVTDTFDYSYDPAGRLAEVTKNGSLLSHYDYDGNSNRTAHTSSSGTVTATYDTQDRLLSYGDKTYAYSSNGDLTSKTQNGQTVTYDYDELGNLRRVVLPEGLTIEYIIDSQNRRVGKKVNGVFGQGFLYKNQLNPIAELDATGAVVARFVYGSRANIPDYMIKGGTTYRILADHLGSPRLVVNAATGQTAQQMDFDEFGRVVLDTNPGFQPFGFAGGLYDHQTGLVRFGARDYDPETGRWTAKDPILFGGRSPNLFEYTFGDPVNFVDSNGRFGDALVMGGVVLLLATGAALTYEVWLTTPAGREWLDRQRRHPLPPLPPAEARRTRYKPGAPGKTCPPPTAIPGARPRVTPPPPLVDVDPEDIDRPTEDDLLDRERKTKVDKIVEGISDLLDWLGGFF